MLFFELSLFFPPGVFSRVNFVMYGHIYGWPEPCIYAVYDRMFGDFPAKKSVYTPYMYGSGRPQSYTVCVYSLGQPDILCSRLKPWLISAALLS